MIFARSIRAQLKSSAGLGKPARTGLSGAGSDIDGIVAATGLVGVMRWGMAEFLVLYKYTVTGDSLKSARSRAVAYMTRRSERLMRGRK